jgi:predicted TPR repeat methyltransferase
MTATTNAEKLVEAEAAYHQLMVGGAVRVVVDQNGERVEYTSVNAANLLRYIADLRNLIALEAGLLVPRGPMGVIF